MLPAIYAEVGTICFIAVKATFGGAMTEEEGCTMRQRIGAARAGQRVVVVVVAL